MTLDEWQKVEIRELLRKVLEGKLAKYGRETTAMPFMVKLMQSPKQVAAYSFIHSLSTMLGMSAYEKISQIVASPHYDEAKRNYDVEGLITDEENAAVSRILQEIKNRDRNADKQREIQEILKCGSEGGRKLKVRADLFLRKGSEEFYVEIKTAKPNIDVFAKSKQKMLELVAIRKKNVSTIIGIPYNPYHPGKYLRFTIQNYLDKKEELYVQEKFWEFLGGDGTYSEILNVFDEVGKEFRDLIGEKIRAVSEGERSV